MTSRLNLDDTWCRWVVVLPHQTRSYRVVVVVVVVAVHGRLDRPKPKRSEPPIAPDFLIVSVLHNADSLRPPTTSNFYGCRHYAICACVAITIQASVCTSPRVSVWRLIKTCLWIINIYHIRGALRKSLCWNNVGIYFMTSLSCLLITVAAGAWGLSTPYREESCSALLSGIHVVHPGAEWAAIRLW